MAAGSPTPARRNAELVEVGDLDELVRQVDRLVDARAWDGLIDLHDRARSALERGKQLWPAASLVEYRLALEAPARWAASVLTEGHGRFTLGPLPEVAASTHTYAELAPHLQPGPAAVMFAHERVVRGEDLTQADVRGPVVFDLPWKLAPWEPDYPLASYDPHRADFPAPELPAPGGSPLLRDRGAAPPRAPIDDPAAVAALRALARTWLTESNGRVEAIAVAGGAVDAIAALGARRIRLVQLTPAQAMAAMSWAAASGGAHGRRRGMASGRYDAWWAAASLCGFDGSDLPPPDELGEAVQELRWYRWDAAEPVTGWQLHLAVEDPQEGLGWAVGASDQAI